MKISALVAASLTLWLAACATAPAPSPGTAPSPATSTPSEQAKQIRDDQQALIDAQRAEQEQEEQQRLKQAKGEQEKVILLGLIQKMMDQGNAYAALAHLDSYDQKFGADLKSRLLRADALRKTNQYDKAEQTYQGLLGSSDDQGKIWYGLGKIAIEKGDMNAAEVRLSKAVELDPLRVEAYSDLGLVYLIEGKKDNSYQTLMKASELSDQDPKVLANLALWGLVYNNFDLSVKIANRLNWSDSTRNQVLAQANNIKKHIQQQGVSK